MSKHAFSLRLYHWLLKLYPASFRENYADPLERQFRDEIADSHGHWSLVMLWIRMVWDLALSAPAQLAREIKQDARHALHLWGRRPVHTAFVIAALAIGIGANTGVFSVVNGLLLRSLPFRDPDRLVATHIFAVPQNSAKQFHDWRKGSTYFEDAAIFHDGDVNLGSSGGTARVNLVETSWNFFSLLGTQPVIGRTFAPNEDGAQNNSVAVIGYGLWQQAFGGSPTVIGSTIRTNGTPLTIIGVAPPDFDYPEQAAVWTPAVFAHAPSSGYVGQTIARLKPGIAFAQARVAFAAEADRLSPNRRPTDKIKYPPRMTRLQDQLSGPVKNASLMLMVGVGLILLIACINVANFLMARTADRAAELSIRSALGASRARLLQQLFTESVLLSLIASAAGLSVAFWATSVAAKVEPAPIAAQAYSILDVRVVSFCIAISVLSGLLFGFLPALYAGRTHSFGTRSSSVTPGSRFVGELLVSAQVMLTIILLASSLSIGRAFLSLMNADRGFETKGLVTMNISVDGTTHQAGDRQLQYFEDALAQVRRIPGVRYASATEFLPLNASVFLGAPFWMDGRQSKDNAMIVPVLPHYFQTMGGRILFGREFNDAEVRADAPVAIINEVFAGEFGNPANAINRQLRLGTQHPRTIVGVVKGMDYMADSNPTQIFFPAHEPGRFFSTIVARVNGRAEDYLPTIRDVVKSVDPQVPVFGVKTMEQRLDQSLARPKFYSTAVLFFAAFALLLAVIGIYGVVSYAVVQRMHELGVRMALGTTSGRLRAAVLGRSQISVAAGAVPGVACALVCGRFLESLIAGATSVNAATCFLSVLFIVAIAGAAVWTATKPIASLDIMDTLRAD
jgi:predicted permease